MAASHRSLIQDQISDVTECSICAEIFTNPKILPCVHTFCLHCLETYGKEKKSGEQMVCPICRREFLIPKGGFSDLPSNFFIGKMVEIGKLAMTPMSKTLCALCPEEDEVLAQLFCVDCEQNLCSRCSNGHKKSRFSQNHQVIELGCQPRAQDLNFRNSYCGNHPEELIKMYCYEDNVAICLICCVESHQSHRCVNANTAAKEFTEQLKCSSGRVASRTAECDELEEKLDKFKKEFQAKVFETEEGIREAANKMTKLIQQHTDQLVQRLKSVAERNLKAFETTKQNVDRFRVMIDSYSRYSEKLLMQGSPVDICRAVDQMLTRAQELETLSANCSGDRFCCDTIAFNPLDLESQLNSGRINAIGELFVTPSSDWLLQFGVPVAAFYPEKEIVEFKGQRMLVTKHEDLAADAGRGNARDDSNARAKEMPGPRHAVSGSFNTVKVSGLPQNASKDMISMYFENKKRSGGGRLRILEHQKKKGKALIKFDNPEDGLGVCNRTHTLSEATLEISPLEMALVDVKSCAIEVKGLGDRATEDFLSMYFENKNRSGGGTVEAVILNNEARTAVIVFEEATAVMSVMKKQPHKLDGVKVEVNVLEPAPPPPLFLHDVDAKRLLAKRLPPSVTRDSLKQYLSSAENAQLVGWTQAVKSSTALLEFNVEPDYLSIRRLVCSKPFFGKMISIRRVPQTSSILVAGIPPSMTADYVAMYFQSPKNGGSGDDCKVEMQPGGDSAIIKLQRPDVVRQITSKRHQFFRKEVKVVPYYKF